MWIQIHQLRKREDGSLEGSRSLAVHSPNRSDVCRVAWNVTGSLLATASEVQCTAIMSLLSAQGECYPFHRTNRSICGGRTELGIGDMCRAFRKTAWRRRGTFSSVNHDCGLVCHSMANSFHEPFFILRSICKFILDEECSIQFQFPYSNVMT